MVNILRNYLPRLSQGNISELGTSMNSDLSRIKYLQLCNIISPQQALTLSL